MKRILILIIGLIGVAYGQSAPTSAKTRFVNGLYLGTKLDSYFNAADSNAIYWRADSSLMAKYKGTARALAFAVSGGYLPISDTASMLSNYRRTSTRIENSDLRFSTISGVSLGASLFGLSTGYGLNGSGYDGGAIRTWEVDTNAISTKANVTGALVGYTTVSRFTDSLTNVQSRIQTKQPLGAYITFADSTTILAGRWLPNRSADSIAVIRALANTKQPIGNYITFADSTTILAGRWLPNRSADSTAVLRALINTKGTGNGTVTSIATNTGTGITGGTITSTGTIAADTTILSTKANVTGTLVGYTTLAQNALKVNIPDTATMLSNYRRTSTKITNSDLANSTISGISLGSNLASLTNGYGISGSAYNGSTGYTWLVDTSAISTKANVTGLLTGYATTSALSGYLPLTAGSGNPLSGDLYITKAAPLVFLNSTSTNSNGFVHQVSGTNYWGTGLNINSTDESWSVFNYSLSAKPISINRTTNAITLGGALSGTSLSMSGEGLFGGAVTNGTDKLIVAGSVYASNSGNTYKSFLGAYYKERNNNGSNAGGYEWEEALGYGVSSTIKGSLQFGNKYVNSFETAARIVLTNAANSQYAALSFDGNTGAATFSSSVTASSLIKSGGTSAQFLMADGSVTTGPFMDLSSNQTAAGNKTFSGITSITNTTAATGTTNGALVVSGGVGVGGSVIASAMAANSGTFYNSVYGAVIRSATATYTTTATVASDITTAFCSGSGYTLTLPSASGITGQLLTVISNTNLTGITLSGVEGGSYTLICNSSLVLISNGTTWKIASNYQNSAACS